MPELLESIETIQRPESLVKMQAISEKMMARLNEIEMRCLDSGIRSQASG
jgi:hypothetical protein